MAFQYLKSRMARGGQFVAFDNDKSSTNSKSRKLAWQQSDSRDIVQQLMNKLDLTDDTTQSSAYLFPADEADNASDQESCSSQQEDCTDCGAPDQQDSTYDRGEEDRSNEFHEFSTEHPLWLKRPMFADICCNHALVNAERQWANPDLHPLRRSRHLDEVAKWHAEEMAKARRAIHSDPTELCAKLSSQPQRRLGQNVAKGKNLRELHTQMKEHSSNYANMMDARYQEFGMATAKASSGDWYLCQIFLG